jgi:hypothetical protein
MTVDLQMLQDRLDVADTLYRYASTIDRRDLVGLRKVLADDMWAQYGNREPMIGGDTVLEWIDNATVNTLWQHHLLSVYHTDIEGDHAKALIYHTSYQSFKESPDKCRVLVARYHNELTRDGSGWRISRLLMEVLWAEDRTDTSGLMEARGGPTQVELPSQ